ncbi:aminotransferase class I/II-fold pyridoxal phosphate-dependent enzyme [Sphingobacterium athyrii]|uniref:1-aminocyclopropane-1-carboxylate synthase n=1 Tax=Sphingobacterium athyrii TaxID=2152717 RepID=A0A363NUW6_9SPHI|nr:aminotransferase class I/II-fold pyridoxal phosphate-dependent enzyme [Sphingobacterium athyrii]PUV24513.1 1-aminocyclopropane-1-carboxylate synthase [Sphingobacterium athyrii]
MSELSYISLRGNRAYNTVVRPDFELYFEASKNIYSAEENPHGTFPLNVADNNLNWPILRERMQYIAATLEIPDWVSGYTSGLGHETFRVALADFLGNFLADRPIAPENIGVAAGATAVIELSAIILADKGDVAVFPAPAYPVYSRDIMNKAGVQRYDLITHHDSDAIHHGPILSIEHLEKAKQDIERQGSNFRLLVVTNPDNPTGGLYTALQLESIAEWCMERKIHFIVNEIYGFVTVNTKDPAIADDYSDHRTFTSFLSIIHKKNSPYLHQWYALSKDLGISGMRVGMVYSLNQAFLTAFNNLNLPHMVSNHTQWLLQNILGDHEFIQDFLNAQRHALTKGYIVVVDMLKKLNIPFVPSYGSLFVWADFSRFLETETLAAEMAFWQELYKNTGVLLTPGIGFGHTKKGMFRIVYTCFDDEELQVAMKRIQYYLTGLPKHKKIATQ